MTYQVYKSDRPMTYVVVKDAAGLQKAQAALRSELGELAPFKTIDSLTVIGMSSSGIVEQNIKSAGYHVQKIDMKFTEM